MDNVFLKINNKSKFIIYGASDRGWSIYRTLKSNNLDVIAFLDKRADKIKNDFNIPVLDPENNKLLDEVKINTIVIITTANYFEQYLIAEFLNGIGYKKILYKINILENKKSLYSKALNEVYELLLNGDSILEYKLPYFNLEEHCNINTDFGLILNDNPSEDIAYVPLQLLFSSRARDDIHLSKFQYTIEASIYTILPHIDLFNVFDGKEGYTIDRYCGFRKEAYSAFSCIDEQEILRSIQDRYKVYKYMDIALNLNKDFFLEHPVVLEWNKKGYFNIVDGHHRTIFFLTKNITKIPCKIKKNDYDNWINKEKLKLCINYIKQNNIKETNTPIPHPYFYFLACRREVFGDKRLSVMCRYFAENDISLKNLNIIDIGSQISYFAQHFSRMGAKVTCVEKDMKSFDLACLLNELLYCSNIEMINNDIIDIIISKKYEVSLVFSLIHKYLFTKKGVWILNIIDNITTKMMFWESGNIVETEKKWILENSTFKTYKKLKIVFEENKFTELGIFYKDV